MHKRYSIILLLILAGVVAACQPAAAPTTITPPTAVPASPTAVEPTATQPPPPTATQPPPPTATTAPQTEIDSGAPLRPGDTLGDFTITTGQPSEAVYGWDGFCQEQPRAEGDATVRYACLLTTSQKFNPCSSAYTFGSGKTLDEIWAGFAYELKINGRPVDLAAFGTYDFTHPQLGPMRIYNVFIVPNQPGEIQIEDLTTMPGAQPVASAAILTFVAP